MIGALTFFSVELLLCIDSSPDFMHCKCLDVDQFTYTSCVTVLLDLAWNAPENVRGPSRSSMLNMFLCKNGMSELRRKAGEHL